MKLKSRFYKGLKCLGMLSLLMNTNPVQAADVTTDNIDVSEVNVETANATDVVNIPDKALADYIRKSVGIPAGDDITVGDMANLYSIYQEYSDIADLTGLEYAVNIDSIILYGSQVTDLSPLANLTNLETLMILDSNITDISAVSDLTKLRRLSFNGNEITDISPIATLTSIESLHLTENLIEDLSPLSTLTVMDSLYIGENNISDLTPLSGLTSLEYLNLDDNKISDVSPLNTLVNIKRLDLNRNNIYDLSALTILSTVVYASLEDQVVNLPDIISTTGTATALNVLKGHNGVVLKPRNLDANTTYDAATNMLTFSNVTPPMTVTYGAMEQGNQHYYSATVHQPISLRVVNVSGLDAVEIGVGEVDTFNLLDGVIASSEDHGTFTVEVTKGISKPAPGTNDTFTVEYTITDEFNTVTIATREVTVTNQLPVISVADVTLDQDEVYDLLTDVTVTDYEDGTISDIVVSVVANARTTIMDTATPGVFVVTYTATDSDGNSVSADRTITVESEPVVNTGPTIEANDLILTVGDTFDPFADVSASDLEDGDLTQLIEIVENTVDTTVSGVYTVTYKVVDSSSVETFKTITVIVVDKIVEDDSTETPDVEEDTDVDTEDENQDQTPAPDQEQNEDQEDILPEDSEEEKPATKPESQPEDEQQESGNNTPEEETTNKPTTGLNASLIGLGASLSTFGTYIKKRNNKNK